MSYPLSDLGGLSNTVTKSLTDMGINSVEKLLKDSATPAMRSGVASKLGISPMRLLKFAQQADLFRIPGIAGQYSNLLQEIGIKDVPDLGSRNAGNLLGLITDHNEKNDLVDRIPKEDEVLGWIDAAKGSDTIIEYGDGDIDTSFEAVVDDVDTGKEYVAETTADSSYDRETVTEEIVRDREPAMAGADGGDGGGGFKLWWLLPLLLIGALLLFLPRLLGGSGGEGAAGGSDDCSSEQVFCVGLVTDVGEVDDKSFNQSAWEGVKLAEEAGATVEYIETTDAKDYAANIDFFAEEGYDAIVTVGFSLGEATTAAAAQYPDIDFIGVDQFQGEAMGNVAGLIFPEDRAGFLAGALAAMMSETGTIAQVLGTDLVPPVVAFGTGFENGAAHVDSGIEVLTTYHPGGLDVAFTDPEWGASTAAQAMGNGADVIFGAGGKTGNGALGEVANAGGAYCIGVDTDQWETVPEAHGCLISSAMKLITPGVGDLLDASKNGSFPGGNFVGEVGLAPFHDFDGDIPQEVKDTLDSLDEDLRSGALSTGY